VTSCARFNLKNVCRLPFSSEWPRSGCDWAAKVLAAWIWLCESVVDGRCGGGHGLDAQLHCFIALRPAPGSRGHLGVVIGRRCSNRNHASGMPPRPGIGPLSPSVKFRVDWSTLILRTTFSNPKLTESFNGPLALRPPDVHTLSVSLDWFSSFPVQFKYSKPVVLKRHTRSNRLILMT
jgi:hypothetical protein